MRRDIEPRQRSRRLATRRVDPRDQLRRMREVAVDPHAAITAECDAVRIEPAWPGAPSARLRAVSCNHLGGAEDDPPVAGGVELQRAWVRFLHRDVCLLYTSDAADERS